MTKPNFTTLLTALIVALGCADPQPLAPPSAGELLALLPASGSGNKQVVEIDATHTDWVTCASGEALDLHFGGWVQVHTMDRPGNRNVQVNDVHLIFTYTNPAGATYSWREVGIDHTYLDRNGDLIISIIGRIGLLGVIGHVKFNTVTQEIVFVAGKNFAGVDALACDALT